MATKLVPIVLASILFSSSTVRLLAQNASDRTVDGTIVARSETTMDVLADGEKQPVRYLIIPDGAKFDAKAMDFIKSLMVGTEVQLTWIPWHDHRFANKVFIIAAAGSGAGLITGTVTDLSATPGKWIWIEVQDDTGKTERYSPYWRSDGLDKEMTAAIARRMVGDRVELRSTQDDHVRVATLRVVGLSPQATTRPGFEGGALAGRVTARDKTSVTIKLDGGQEQRFLPQEVAGTKKELDRAMTRAIAAVNVGDRVEGEWFSDSGQRRIISLNPVSATAHAPATKP